MRLFDTDIALASSVTVDLPLPLLYTHTPVNMPVRVMRGRKPGPTLLVTAAIHGDEINGVEVIRRLLALASLKRLRGTLIAVPVVNVLGMFAQSRYLPDRRDLNRSFPGSEGGSLASRLAKLFVDQLLIHADYGIDLHTGAIHRSNLPQVRGNLSVSAIRAMAQAFGTPVILDSGNKLIDGSLRKLASEREVPYIVYEGGEALRFDELAIRAGVRGIISVMRTLGMLQQAKKPAPEATIASRSSWLRAPQSGIVRAAVPLGAQVEEDQILAWIGDPFGDQDSAVRARFAGIVIGKTNLPLINEGDALFNVASIPSADKVEEQLENYHEQLSETPEWADPSLSDLP